GVVADPRELREVLRLRPIAFILVTYAALASGVAAAFVVVAAAAVVVPSVVPFALDLPPPPQPAAINRRDAARTNAASRFAPPAIPETLHSKHGSSACIANRLRAAAQAAAAAHRLDRPGRRRDARGRPRQAKHQARVEGLGARARDPLLRPDDAGRTGHARQGRSALLEGCAPGSLGRGSAIGRRRLRLPEPRAGRRRAP